MTLEAEAIAKAFSQPVQQAGLAVRSGPLTKPLLVHLAVLDPQRDDHLVAVFEAAINDYVGVELDNGAHFWEHEWDQSGREERAAELGAVTAAHVAGSGTYEKGGRAYRVTVGGRSIRTREPVDPKRRLKP